MASWLTRSADLPGTAGKPMTTKIELMISAAALALAGCVSNPAPDLAQSHPANPEGAQSVYPPHVPFLMTATNLVMKPLTEPTPEHQHSHEQHGTKPKTEEKK